MSTKRRPVVIVEVAPRDGFQVVKPFIPTATRIAVCEALGECAFQRMAEAHGLLHDS